LNGHYRTLRLVAAVAFTGLVALACGGGTSGGGGASSKGEIDVGVDLPMSGAEASNGVPTLNGVKFAVDQINAQGGIKGFRLGVDSLDDSVNGVHNPQKGAQNVQQLAANPKVLAMVGPFNSNVGQAEIPVANRVNLPIISPANTNPCLTKEYEAGGGCAKYAGFTPQQLRPNGTNNYFRVAGTDDHQGPANADYLYSEKGIRKVAVADDNETYGKGIAVAFANRWKGLGGDIVGSIQDIDTTTTSDFRSFLTSAKNGGAQAIYFGGVDANKACVVRSQMKGIFDISTPFAGGDGIVTAQCLKDAADMAVGMHGTVATIDADHLPAAKDTIAAFRKAFPNANDYGAYTMPAYACTQIIAAALSSAIDAAGGNMPTRQQVLSAIAKSTNVPTVLGPITFDKNGDNSQQIISLYQSVATDPSHASSLSGPFNDAKTVGWNFVEQKNYA
jgi:branched-chain amino acid transport system substrate-binding protein